MEQQPLSAMEAFAELNDLRWRACRYPLDENLLTTLCTVLCGVDDWETMTLWERSQLDWLRRRLPFVHGIPSPDTVRWVFGRSTRKPSNNASRHGSARCATRWRASISSLTARACVAAANMPWDEDASQIRDRDAARNLAFIRSHSIWRVGRQFMGESVST